MGDRQILPGKTELTFQMHADPGRHERDQINTWDGGRGLYFDDPNGHLLETVRTAALVRRHPDLTPWSRRH